MHEEYAKDGLVILSVSTDLANARAQSDEPVPAMDMVAKIQKFLKHDLKEQVGVAHVPFSVWLLDEDLGFLQEKLRFELLPCAFVFNRQGQWTQFSGDRGEFDAKKIEDLVKKLIREK